VHPSREMLSFDDPDRPEAEIPYSGGA
jgi:hypothetical protein